ncbi:MAG TPA: 2'-5' RNA ligase family protein [Terriglobia bacterium]|nr:2'-5' RNA ligase family protein [Terriglobia bacterium]
MQQTELFAETDRPADRDARKHCDRLFFAVMPDLMTASHIHKAALAFHQAQGLDRMVQPVNREHVSVLLVGDYRQRLREKHVYAAKLAARRVVMSAFDITLDAVGSFAGASPALDQPSHCPLVLRAGDEGLRVLCDQLRRAMGRQPVPANKELIPHLTLSYGPEMIVFRPVTPIRFTAGEFVLIHSEVGLTRYHVLGRWSLRGGGARTGRDQFVRSLAPRSRGCRQW